MDTCVIFINVDFTCFNIQLLISYNACAVCYCSVEIIGFLCLLSKAHFCYINPGTPEYRNTYKKTFFVTYL